MGKVDAVGKMNRVAASRLALARIDALVDLIAG